MLYEAAGNTTGTEHVVSDMLNALADAVDYASAAELWRVLRHPTAQRRSRRPPKPGSASEKRGLSRSSQSWFSPSHSLPISGA